MKNARFWVWGSKGPVKVTLSPGQTLAHYSNSVTDEGYESTAVVLSYNMDSRRVQMEVTKRSRDCDGPLDKYVDYQASISELKERQSPTEPEVSFPLWKRECSRQRDLYAERMGY